MNAFWIIIKTKLQLLTFGTDPANDGEISYNGSKFRVKENGAVKDLIASAQSQGDLTNSLTAKVTPVDADMFTMADSADTNIWKKVTGSVMKTFLNYWTLTSGRLNFDGNIALGSTSLVTTILAISKAITGSTIAQAVSITSEVDSSVTSTAYGQFNTVGTKAASFTLGQLTHHRIGQGVFGAGSVVTNQYGVNVDSSLIGGTTTNQAFRASIPSGTGRWNFYAAGTAQNYFEGNLVMNSPIIYKVYTVATLPTPTIYMRAFVSDATAPTFGATVVGGGAVKTPVWYDGSAWKVG